MDISNFTICSQQTTKTKLSYSLKVVMLCGWVVKAGMVCEWVAGKTV